MAIDQREAINVAHFGAVGDGVTDDTAAIQAAIDFYGQSDSGAIVFPDGDYKVTNSLFMEGGVSYGLRLRGAIGGSRGGTGASLVWFGHAGAGMFHGLGMNALTMEHLDVRCDSSTKMKWGILLDSTNSYDSTVTVNTTSLVRTSSIVTVTTATNHELAAGNTLRIAGASTASFNGTFLVLTVPTTTTATYIQTGSNASTSGGTTSKYKQAAGSSGCRFSRMTIRDTAGSSLNVSGTISRNGTVGTVTTSAAHYCLPGDTIKIAGVTDSTFDGYYIVSAITSASVLAYIDTQDAASSSGGTVLTDAYSMAFGHRDVVTQQVSEVTLDDVVLIGNFSTSLHGLKWNTSGNVKNYAINRGSANGFHYGVDWSPSAGTLLVTGMIIGSCSKADFVCATGTLTLVGVQSESASGRFITGSTGGNPGHLNVMGCSYEGTLDSDDVLINYGGTIQLIGNNFNNNRTGSSYPKIALGTPTFTGSAHSTLTSVGNHYNRAPAGFLPVQDGQGNPVLADGYYANRACAVTSIGDSGGESGALVSLSNVLPTKAIVSQQAAATWIPTSGFLRLAAADTLTMANNAGNADLTILSKDASDITTLGGAAGIKAAAYRSSDGTAGVTAGPYTVITSITVKNGLITAIAGS